MAGQDERPQSGQQQRTGQLRRIAAWSVGVVVAPAQTLRIIATEKPVGVAVLVIIASAAITSGASGLFGNLSGIILRAVLGVFFVVPAIALTALFFHLTARAFGGRGAYAGLFTAFGFMSVVSVFTVPLAAVTALGGFTGAAVGTLVPMVALVWASVLAVIAVRENYGVTIRVAMGVFVVAIVSVLFSAVALALLLILGLIGGVMFFVN